MPSVMTVTGPVEPERLGVTLPHEHLYVDTALENRGRGVVVDERLLRTELERFEQAGGRTIVELSTDEIGRNPVGLRHLSEATGVKIVMGCGHYRDPYLDRRWFDRTPVDAIAAAIVREIRDGVGDTGVRPGIIGEIGCDRHFVGAAEERSFRAAARAHRETGLTITTHAAQWPVGRQQLALLLEEGVDPGRIVIGHCDTVPDPAYHLELAAAGCFVAFDCVGTGYAWDHDATVGYVLSLVAAGHGSQVLLSHDVHLRGHHWLDGGCGFTFIFEELKPRLAAEGFDDDRFEQLVVANPRAALTGERVTAGACVA